jgi:hypothetical protein
METGAAEPEVTECSASIVGREEAAPWARPRCKAVAGEANTTEGAAAFIAALRLRDGRVVLSSAIGGSSKQTTKPSAQKLVERND